MSSRFVLVDRDTPMPHICGGSAHPDHDTICAFRVQNANLFQESFVKVLEFANYKICDGVPAISAAREVQGGAGMVAGHVGLQVSPPRAPDSRGDNALPWRLRSSSRLITSKIGVSRFSPRLKTSFDVMTAFRIQFFAQRYRPSAGFPKLAAWSAQSL